MLNLKLTAFISLTILSTCFQVASAQQQLSLAQLSHKGDSLYTIKKYPEAIQYYQLMADKSDFPNKKASAFYNIACCYNLNSQPDPALQALKQAIDLGYPNKAHVSKDTDLNSLHQRKEWQQYLDRMPDQVKDLNSDPSGVKFITSDIRNFWKAYDMAILDTAHFRQVMKQEYFDKASKGMNEYMGIKVGSIDFFIKHIRSAPKFYQAIRQNTLKVEDYKAGFLKSYVNFKSLYPEALFPNVYFVVGAFTSGGTSANSGLLLGINQNCLDETIPVTELSVAQQTRTTELAALPGIVAHELIHFQQDGMKRDTTTLSAAIQEGMADFLGELISGEAPGPKLYTWAKGREQAIWARFKKDMDYNRYSNWIANSNQTTPDHLPDQGYWVGYQICKAYYQHTDDKKKAINDMLHIQNYHDFLDKSQWDHMVTSFSVSH